MHVFSSSPWMKREFLFGSSSVVAALKAGRRQLYRLHLSKENNASSREGGRLIDAKDDAKRIAANIASQKGINVVQSPQKSLDIWSDGRPHQGMVLETGPLLLDRISNLDYFDHSSEMYSIVYGKNDHKEVRSHRPLPVWLALDQVVDPQNLGAILRSSHFLDVDGVILTEKETAPLSKSVSKASSGALEVMDNLFLTTSLQRFLKNSAECGWMVYGTDLNGESRSAYSLRRDGLRQPSILVLGNEGRGMRSVVSSCCDNHLMIPKMSRGRKDQEYEFVDSLNVSVAAGILLSEMMNSPMNGT